MRDLSLKKVNADPRGRVHAVRPDVTVHVAVPRPITPKAAPVPVAPVSDIPDDPETSYVAAGVDRRELRKLRRGEHAPVQRLDLHGLKSAEAVAKVKRFIQSARVSCRCVAIVHGRGLNSTDNVAVLKPRVREALRQLPGVLAFSNAPGSDGGSGAVYVLLKKA